MNTLQDLVVDNIKAISTIKLNQSDKPNIETLKLFRGAGIFKEAGIFGDRNKAEWVLKAREILHELLSEKELNSIRSTGLFNSHYTKPKIIKFVWERVNQLHLVDNNKRVRVLDPGCGTGSFWWHKPKELFGDSYGDSFGDSALVDCEYTGVEICPLVSLIGNSILIKDTKAQVLNQDFTRYTEFAKCRGLEFDLIIGNLPFVSAKKSQVNIDHKKTEVGLHLEMLDNALELLAPGGILAVITSSSLLDAGGKKYRSYRSQINQKVELVEAYRLPVGKIFYGQSLAPSDLVIFKRVIFRRSKGIKTSKTKNKFVESIPSEHLEAYTNKPKKIPINEYYHQNPENIIGDLVLDQTTLGKRLTCNFTGTDDELIDKLNSVLNKESTKIMNKNTKTSLQQVTKIFLADKEGAYFHAKDFVDNKCVIEHDQPARIWGLANAYLARWRKTTSNLACDKLNVCTSFGENEMSWDIGIKSEQNTDGEPLDLAQIINSEIDFNVGKRRPDSYNDKEWEGYLKRIDESGRKQSYLEMRSRYEIPDQYLLATENLPFDPNEFFLLDQIQFYIEEEHFIPRDLKAWDWDIDLHHNPDWTRKATEFDHTFAAKDFQENKWSQIEKTYSEILENSPDISSGRYTPLHVRLIYNDQFTINFLFPLQQGNLPWHGASDTFLGMLNNFINFNLGEFQPPVFRSYSVKWQDHLDRINEGSIYNYFLYLKDNYQISSSISNDQLKRSNKASTKQESTNRKKITSKVTEPEKTQNTTNTKNKNHQDNVKGDNMYDLELFIPGSKFKDTSCYSFIVRFCEEVEIYFHPDATLKSDMVAWLNQQKLEASGTNPQLYYGPLKRASITTVRSLLQKASRNGAYEIPKNTTQADVNNLQDRLVQTKATSANPLVEAITAQVTALIDTHMFKIEEKIEEKIEAAGNKTKIEEYELKIKSLKTQIQNTEQELLLTKDELSKVKSEFKSLVGDSETTSPFASSPISSPTSSSTNKNTNKNTAATPFVELDPVEQNNEFDHLISDSPLTTQAEIDSEYSDEGYDELNDQTRKIKPSNNDLLDEIDLNDKEFDNPKTFEDAVSVKKESIETNESLENMLENLDPEALHSSKRSSNGKANTKKS